MKFYLRKNWKIILAIFILVAAFGWFEARPTYIKHICSWSRKYQDAQPASPGVTSEEVAQSEKQRAECLKNQSNSNIDCLLLDIHILKYSPPQPAQPAKDWYEPATKQEYEFCLHDQGF